jgi:hypothetical protein
MSPTHPSSHRLQTDGASRRRARTTPVRYGETAPALQRFRARAMRPRRATRLASDNARRGSSRQSSVVTNTTRSIERSRTGRKSGRRRWRARCHRVARLRGASRATSEWPSRSRLSRHPPLRTCYALSQRPTRVDHAAAPRAAVHRLQVDQPSLRPKRGRGSQRSMADLTLGTSEKSSPDLSCASRRRSGANRTIH